MENSQNLPPSAVASPDTRNDEIRATFAFRYRDRVTIDATVRITPASLIATAILISAILLPTFWFARQKRSLTSHPPTP